MAARNTSLWEARINMIDGSRQQNRLEIMFLIKICILIYDYRERVGTLSNENETLRDQMRQTEKDTLDVVTILKKQDLDKDTEVNSYHY